MIDCVHHKIDRDLNARCTSSSSQEHSSMLRSLHLCSQFCADLPSWSKGLIYLFQGRVLMLYENSWHSVFKPARYYSYDFQYVFPPPSTWFSDMTAAIHLTDDDPQPKWWNTSWRVRGRSWWDTYIIHILTSPISRYIYKHIDHAIIARLMHLKTH